MIVEVCAMRVAKRTERETAVWVLIVVLLGVVWFAIVGLVQRIGG